MTFWCLTNYRCIAINSHSPANLSFSNPKYKYTLKRKQQYISPHYNFVFCAHGARHARCTQCKITQRLGPHFIKSRWFLSTYCTNAFGTHKNGKSWNKKVSINLAGAENLFAFRLSKCRYLSFMLKMQINYWLERIRIFIFISGRIGFWIFFFEWVWIYNKCSWCFVDAGEDGKYISFLICIAKGWLSFRMSRDRDREYTRGHSLN